VSYSAIHSFIHVGTSPCIVVPLIMTTTCYVVHDRFPYWFVFNDLVIIFVSNFHSMTLVFLSDHKRILLHGSYIQFIPTLTIIHLVLTIILSRFQHHSFLLIHTHFHNFTIVSLFRRLLYCNFAYLYLPLGMLLISFSAYSISFSCISFNLISCVGFAKLY